VTYDCIYILSNPSIKGVKIGRTGSGAAGVRARMKELQTTGVPEKFVCEYAALVENSSSLEKELHEFLSEYRTSSNREFFTMDPTVVKFLIEIKVNRKTTEITSEVNQSHPNKTSPPEHSVSQPDNTTDNFVSSSLRPDSGCPERHKSFSELLSRYKISKQTLYNRMNALGIKKDYSDSSSNKSYYRFSKVLMLDSVEKYLRQGIHLSKIHSHMCSKNELH
jgi:hypothetical protein